MTEKVWVRWRIGVLFVGAVAGCARTELYLDSRSSRRDDGDSGASATGGANNATGGRGAFGGTTAGSTTTGGRFGGMPGTGGVPTGGTSGRGGSSGTSGSGGITSTRICPALIRDNLDEPALAYISRDQLLFHRPSGATIRVNANATAAYSRIWREDHFLALLHRGQNQAQNQQTLSLVERDGNVLWSTSELGGNVEPDHVWVNSRGDASVLMTDEAAFLGLVILANGTTFPLRKYPQGAPDELGWVPIADAAWFGFLNVLTGQISQSSLPPARLNFLPLVWGGWIVYVAMSPEGPGMVLRSPELERFFPIPGLDVASSFIEPTAVGLVVVEHGVPRAVLDGASLALAVVGPLVRDPAFEGDTVFNPFGGDWGLVVEGQVPRYRVDLRNGAATRLDPPFGAPVHETTLLVMNESWALGTTVSSAPLFRVDLVNARVGPVDLGPLAPLRRLEDSNCGSPPVLLTDGSLALALRNETSASMYVGQPSQAAWGILGRPVSHVVSFAANRRTGAWILSADSGRDRFCNGGGWPPFDELPEGVLIGDSVQVVMPDRPGTEVAFEDHRLLEFVFHESGLCAFVRGTIIDFPTGERTALPPDASQVTFW